ncbi:MULTISPECIES: histidine phosphatase family protein [Nocardiopsis]|uniref:histidine phosphatase family protein n=1 Tax=Nocardiopsis TaxID=2013 RepID=UPI0003465C26|nr:MULTISPECIES: histidine phosphatase family protein [Nocardiopsis]PWV46835.1 putative phosphoglycerate mutase [Nocardiopsis sp. L17-MgMaSL7]
MAATRHLYLARHAQADPDTGELTETGHLQADLLGARLSEFAPHTLWHGPLPRAAQTAHLVASHLEDVTPVELPEAGDYAPHLPRRHELPTAHADGVLDFLSRVPAAERSPELGQRALELLTGPVEGGTDRREVVITHAYLVAWLVTAALDAPPWRWVSVGAANAGLTVIRYAPDTPASVVTLNELTHLPDDLRWTGFPPHLRP